MKTSFWGKSLEVKPIGLQHVIIKSTEEHYVIERPTSSVNNLIFGDMYIEHTGKLIVRNLNTKSYCEVEFKKRGWSGKNANEVEGWCCLPSGEKRFKIFGNWTEQLTV